MMKRDRLPTLAEVLGRKSAPPVDLYCYYLFLQREGAEDTLDFWLDCTTHENLVRAYFRDLSKHGRNVKEEWPRYYEVARKRGSAWNGVNGVTADAVAQAVDVDDENALDAGRQPSSLDHNNEKIGHDQQASDFSDARTPARGMQSREYLGADDAAAAGQTMEFARLSQRTPSPTSNGPRPDYSANFSPTLRALYPHDREREGRTSPLVNEMGENIPSTSTRHSSKFGTARRSIGAVSARGNKQSSTTPYIQRDSAITRTDLIASAERIYARYLMPGAEKEIYLPNVLRVHDFPISSGSLPHTASEPNYDLENDTLARVPDMFHSQKEWVYRAMEQDSFPRFLRSKAFGNLTPASAMFRLLAGLFVLWIALSTSFAFIFLDVSPKAKRLWVSRLHPKA